MSKEKRQNPFLSSQSPVLSPQSSIGLYVFSLLVVFATLLLILAGGLVTSHEAGLAVPDWPLSYGQHFPPMVGNIFWEHGHRMIAGSVGIFTLIMAVWIQIREHRKRLKKLAWAAFAAVILQAILGGLTVLFLLPPAVSIFHACLAQTFFCIVAAVAYFLSPQSNMSETQKKAAVRFVPKKRTASPALERSAPKITGSAG